MLANSFLKPEVLGISEEEVAALIRVLGMLERKEFTFGRMDKDGDTTFPTGPMTFHMNCSYMEEECGTVACIGGWAAKFMGRNPRDYVNDAHGGLRPLFWPGGKGFYATRAQAAIALRNYLTTGEPRWAEALADV